MVRFTARAKENIQKLMTEAGAECVGLRVRAHKVGHHTFCYQLNFMHAEDSEPTDVTADAGSFKAFLDPQTEGFMANAEIDFIEDETGSGFHIDNPAGKPDWTDLVEQKVQAVIDEVLKPALAQHGGWVELVRIDGAAAHVQLGGGCQGCAGARATLKGGIEAVITRAVPEITEVIDDTDHSVGDDPFHSH